MTRRTTNEIRVLAIDPSTRGFGYAVLEGAEMLIDWGVKSTRSDKHREGLTKVSELFDLLRPDVIVLEDLSGKGSRRCERVKKFISGITELAMSAGIKTRSIVAHRAVPWRDYRNDVWRTGEKIELWCGIKEEFICGSGGAYR